MTEPLFDRIIRSQNWLEGWADFIQKVVGGFYGLLGPVGRWLKNLLHGSSLFGHPLHPAITDVPIGAWITMVVLDVVSHYDAALPHRAAEIVLLVGLVAGLGAVATGYTDFHETFGQERRVALAHGLTMSVVALLMLASLLLRHFGGHGAYTWGVILSWIGLALVLLGGYLGGHVVYGFGTTVNRNAFSSAPEKFTDVGASGEFAENQLRKVNAGDFAALITRKSGKLCAIGAVCSHAGGPLEEGKLDENLVTCPWHGSRFDVCTGAVRGGPATFPQPQLEVKEENGRVSIKGTTAH